jgi:hypothetical protein
MADEWNQYVTMKNGDRVHIRGSIAALGDLSEIFVAAGAKWHDGSGSWDFGFYAEPEPAKDATS